MASGASANAGALDCMVVVGFTLQLDADVATARALLEEAARYWGLLAFAGGRGRQVVLVAHQR